MTYPPVTCSICGKMFARMQPRQRYCSAACRKLNVKQWKQEHRDRWLQIKRESIRKRRREIADVRYAPPQGAAELLSKKPEQMSMDDHWLKGLYLTNLQTMKPPQAWETACRKVQSDTRVRKSDLVIDHATRSKIARWRPKDRTKSLFWSAKKKTPR